MNVDMNFETVILSVMVN